MHKAWVMNDYSGFEGLRLEQFPDQEPGPGEVRLRIEAFALNWGDMDLMEDRYSYSFSSFPARIGMEAAGIVDARASDPRYRRNQHRGHCRPGDRAQVRRHDDWYHPLRVQPGLPHGGGCRPCYRHRRRQ